MKKILLALMLMLGLGASAQLSAQTTQWTNDKAHSRVGFEVKHGGVSFTSGHFGDFDIQVTSSGKNYQGTQILATIKTQSINTGIEARDNHLRSADFFNAATQPEMKFQSTRFVVKGKDKVVVYGNLTLAGVTQRVVLQGRLVGDVTNPKGQRTAGFRLNGTIKRSDFNFGTKFAPALIGTEVSIIIDAEFSPAN